MNYNAWACAGSDNLWAGIITALTVAVEAEFGAITARLFRMLEVESVNEDANDRRECRIFVKLGEDEKLVKQILTERGVLTYCRRYRDWKKETNKNTTSNSEIMY